MPIPPDHFERCPSRRLGVPCCGNEPGRRGYPIPRMCELFESDPERYTPCILRESCADAGMPIPTDLLGLDLARIVHATDHPAGSIRVGFAMPCLRIGGGERWCESMVRLVPNDRFVVVGVGVKERPLDGPIAAEVARRVPIFEGADGIRLLSRQCDVLVTWGVPDIWELVGNARSRVVCVSHGTCEYTRDHVSRSARAAGVVAVTRPAREPFPEDVRHKARIIQNCVSVERATLNRDAMRERWRIPEGLNVLGWYGRISSEKAPGSFLDAIEALPSDRWIGVMVGPYFERITPEITARGLDDRIRVVGPSAETANVLCAFDRLLVTSPDEGACLSAMEAMAVGCPVVMTPVGVALESPGLVAGIPIGADGPTLAAAILADLADVEGTARRVDDARRVAERRWSPVTFARRWRRAIAAAAAAPSLADDFARIQTKVAACPHRGPRLPHRGCSCWHVCLDGKGAGDPDNAVTDTTCMRCIQTAENDRDSD